MARLRYVVPILYFVAVLICLLIAFDFDGRLRNSGALFAAVILTLPWSMVTILFMWALFHGAGLEFFFVMYLLFAGVNAFFVGRMFSRKDTEVVE